MTNGSTPKPPALSLLAHESPSQVATSTPLLPAHVPDWREEWFKSPDAQPLTKDWGKVAEASASAQSVDGPLFDPMGSKPLAPPTKVVDTSSPPKSYHSYMDTSPYTFSKSERETSGHSHTPLKYTSYVKTSDSHPIDVNFFSSKDLPLPGALGMTYAPGKTQERGMTGDHARDLATDLDRMVTHYKVGALVTLIEKEEIKALKIPELFKAARIRAIETMWFPFKDQTVPIGLHALHNLVRKMIARLESGVNVVVHCKGGLGRTGLVAACLMCNFGFSAADAVDLTRKVRPYTLQTAEQVRYVYMYGDYIDAVYR